MQNVIIIINVYLLCSCRQMSERFASKKFVIKLLLLLFFFLEMTMCWNICMHIMYIRIRISIVYPPLDIVSRQNSSFSTSPQAHKCP